MLSHMHIYMRYARLAKVLISYKLYIDNMYIIPLSIYVFICMKYIQEPLTFIYHKYIAYKHL